MVIDILSQRCEYPLLIALQKPEDAPGQAQKHLEELRSLVETLGMEPCKSLVVTLRKNHPRFLLGKGKVEEIDQLIDENEADLVVFDDDLSPAQQRNLETLWDTTVIDRREVILDIFGDRAVTREAELQVELARLEYMMPRLTRAWTHLSRQKGGTKGTRGEGEKQLEVDRRLLKHRLSRLKKELEEITRVRSVRRKQRQEGDTPRASLVGYTNAGKSSLLNKLADSDVFVKDQLFATLDPTTRRVELPRGGVLLVTDTVGFIRKLPHHLVDAFHSTLEETLEADFLIHVVDASDPQWEDHLKTSEEVLAELGAGDKECIYVFNKMDRLSPDEKEALSFRTSRYSRVCPLSVHQGQGLTEFLALLEEVMHQKRPALVFSIPHSRYDLTALLHREAQILEKTEEDEGVTLRVRCSPRIAEQLKEFRVQVSKTED